MSGVRARPTLTLVYLPHLDYDLQRFGPDDPRDRRRASTEIDAVAGDLIADAQRDGARVIVLSEYGITAVSTPDPHQPRAARRPACCASASRTAANCSTFRSRRPSRVADHQIAHVYVPNPDLIGEVRAIVSALPGVERVLDRPSSARSASIIRAPASSSRWRGRMPGSPITTGSTTAARRTSRAWSRSIASRATTRSSCSSIRRSASPKLALGWRLAKRALGLRTLMDVIPLDAGLVKGSHGRLTDEPNAGPLFISSEPRLLPDGPVAATGVKDTILAHVFAA